MKPTQQEIIELAREAGFNDPVPSDGFMGLAYDKRDGSDTGGSLERLVHLALERFGAGGGELSRDMPHGWITNWPAPSGGTRPVYHASAIKPKYGPELDNSLVSYPVFTRPGSSPTALRAEYLRGLDDAAKLADEVSSRCLHPDEIGEAIRALKGKQ